MARTLNTLNWNTLYTLFVSFQKEDATTAASRILEYVDAQVNASVEAGLGTYEQVKASFKNNCVSDKRCRIKAALKSATGNIKADLENKMSLVDIFDGYTKGVTRRNITNPTTDTDSRKRYTNPAMTRSKWQYTKEELKAFDGDELFWKSIYNNIASAQSKYPEKVEQYFGADWYNISCDARDYARDMARATRLGVTHAMPTNNNLSLEEKIKRGMPVVITPAVIAELQRLYPNGATNSESTGECMEEVDPSSIAHEDADTTEVVIEDAEVSDITAIVPAATVPATPAATPVAPTVDISVMAAAKQLADICKDTEDQMIHGYELDVDWDDIDEMLDKIIKAFPDTFDYDEETDEILYFEN